MVNIISLKISPIPAFLDDEITVYVVDINGNENGLYRDTVINVSFENAVKSGKTKKWYVGKLTLNVVLNYLKKGRRK